MKRICALVLTGMIILLSTCSLMSYDSVDVYEDLYLDDLPIFYIHPKPPSKDYYTDVTVIYKGETYEAEGKIRGGGSAYFPKKSYTIKFDEDNLFSDTDIETTNEISSGTSTGFSEREKIILVSNFDDNSYLRNRLAYWMWGQFENSFTIDTFSAPVYLNGAYEGLYTVVDFINEDYLEEQDADVDGELFKGVTEAADFYNDSDPLEGFEKKAGTPEEGVEGAFDNLEEFITAIDESSDSDFETVFETYADVQSYYDWWFFCSFLQAWDSDGKNTYHYYGSVDSDDVKWHFIPWDFNQSFGQRYNTKRLTPVFDTDTISNNGIWYRLIDSDFQDGTYSTTYNFNERYSSSSGLLSSSSTSNIYKDTLTDMVDDIYADIELAAERDFEKWEEEYIDEWDDVRDDDYTTVDEEIAYIKNWIDEQYDLFDDVY